MLITDKFTSNYSIDKIITLFEPNLLFRTLKTRHIVVTCKHIFYTAFANIVTCKCKDTL